MYLVYRILIFLREATQSDHIILNSVQNVLVVLGASENRCQNQTPENLLFRSIVAQVKNFMRFKFNFSDNARVIGVILLTVLTFTK